MFDLVRTLLLGLLLFSGNAYSAEYTWGSPDLKSPKAACAQARTSMDFSQYNGLTGFSESPTNDPSVFNCRTVMSEERYNSTYARVYRSGDSCPPNTEYNPQTGECVDQCKTQEPKRLEFLYCYDYEGTGGCSAGTAIPRPSSFCSGGCGFEPDYSSPEADADCYSYSSGDEGAPSGPAVMCGVTSKSSGACPAGTPDDPEPSPSNECPAGMSGGVVNGKNVCVASSGGGSDGGDTGGGSDGGDTGGGNESGGDTGGGGNEGGGDTGGGDTGGGGNTGGGNSGGTGGTGDTGGTGEGEGEGEGEGSGSGESVANCDDGRCGFGDERGDPFGGDVRSFSDSLTAAMDGMKNSPLANSIGNIQFPTDGTCPTGSTSINIGFGSIGIELSEHCNFWEQIAPILSAAFMALWSVIAVRVFLSA